jgi:hypothetical protein
MKALMLTVIAGSLFYSTAFAELCGEKNALFAPNTPDQEQCTTIAAGAGAATASGIYAAKKYSTGHSIEERYTEKLFNISNGSGENARLVEKSMNGLTNGDRVTITYNLSEADNREYHIDLMREKASSSRTAAATYGALALTATKTVSTTDSSGKTSYRTEPDYVARTSYALMATNSLADAANFDRKAMDARHGGPVPMYDIDKIVKVKSGTLQVATQFTTEKITNGGKILKVDRLPVEHFNSMKSAIWKARGGVVGAAVGVGFVAEEAVSGMAADQYREVRNAPKAKSYSGNQ